MNIKRLLVLGFALIAAVAVLASCGSDTASSGEKQEITVGITPGFSEEVMEEVVKEADKQGLKVVLKTFSDYVTPNQALAAGDIDLNSYQHVPFMEAFNQKNGTDLVSIGDTYLAPLAVYSHKIKSLDELKAGDTIAIPNDPTNGSRALILLQQKGIIKLDPNKDQLKAVPQDIVENPKILKFLS